MAYSFTKIEQDKSRVILVVFCVLILFYFLTFWFLLNVVLNYQIFFQSSPRTSWIWAGGRQAAGVLLFALVIGLGHWSFSTHRMIDRVLRFLHAAPPDDHDARHRQFRNIVDEVKVATGYQRPIEPMVASSRAMNAFAMSDFNGRAVIGVTEGLLSRLSRAQLEAVVGHEAAHIVSGDSLGTSVTSSMFDLYSGMLAQVETALSAGTRSSRRSGGGVALLLVVYLLILIARTMAQLLRMFISRQREYRADAIAVRLTRDPLSLAQALYSMTFHWSGAGLAQENISPIFTVSPASAEPGEGGSIFATHPPVKRRLKVLLDMAHTGWEELEDEYQRQKARHAKTGAPVAVGAEPRWEANKDGAWQGPFTTEELKALSWLTPQTWIQPAGGGFDIQQAFAVPELHDLFGTADTPPDYRACPYCRVALTKMDYEDVEVDQCPQCRGYLVHERDIRKIIIREDMDFSDEIKRQAEALVQDEANVVKQRQVIQKDLLPCPVCRSAQIRMIKMFYTMAYRIEIDKCIFCGHVWFDPDELELLQYLIEYRNQPKAA